MRFAEQALLTEPETLEEFFTRGGACFGGGDRFRISTVKLLADGSLGARTAFLREPYSDAPDTCGLPIYPEQAQLDRLVVTAHRHNMAVAIHAIGDGAAEMVLNAFQRARAELPWLHPRHGMVHCQILSEGQLRRMAELDVTAFVQPVFINGDMHIAPGRLGGNRLAHSYAWGDMERLGLHMAFGTDCPVERFHPWRVYCAVTRRDFTGNGPFLPEQALTPYQALYAYTAGGAYASGEERIKGRIRSGLLADFLLVDRNLLTCPPEELLSARCCAPMWAGRASSAIHPSEAKQGPQWNCGPCS
ncbi:amidohydrolase family protein [Flavonifractor plautii]|nr:amidohydrolase family protein [Flavonifractor plautii]